MAREFQVQGAVAQAQALGYSVNRSFDGYTVTNIETGEQSVVPTVYRVEGFGISTQIGSTDENAWHALTVKEAHEHRVNFSRHVDPNDDFTMSDREIFESSLQSQVALNQITKAEMKSALSAYDEAQKGS
jgi:hypothetical protein